MTFADTLLEKPLDIKRSRLAMFEKPFVFSMGPQSAGAHFIYDYFAQRKDVCLPVDLKEVFFFDRHFQRGINFYDSYFPVRAHHNFSAEVSTTAFDHPDAPRRVREVFGRDVTLLCPLRHPVERSLAVYEAYKRYGIVSGTIEQAVHQAPQILHASHYATHLQRWFDVFGRESVEIFDYEHGVNNHGAYLQRVCGSVGVPYVGAPYVKWHKGGWRSAKNLIRGVAVPLKLDEEAREKNRLWLQRALATDIDAIEGLLGQGYSHWRI